MRVLRSHGALAALGCVLMVAVGCGDKGPGKLLPVSGTVQFKAAPLDKGTVIYRADSGKGNKTPHEPRGEIDAQGKYTLFTAGKPGAPPGWYKVAVVAIKEDAKPGDPYAVPKWLIPKNYTTPETSPLSVEVKEGQGPEAYELKVADAPVAPTGTPGKEKPSRPPGG
jgi:hypothetical protein